MVDEFDVKTVADAATIEGTLRFTGGPGRVPVFARLQGTGGINGRSSGRGVRRISDGLLVRESPR
jgi:hypothetical protein